MMDICHHSELEVPPLGKYTDTPAGATAPPCQVPRGEAYVLSRL
jgi:hypothetical protein